MDTRQGTSPEFPARLSQRLSIGLALILLVILAAGGLSLYIAFEIFRANSLVRQEYLHALEVGQLHLKFHDIISVVEHYEATGEMEGLEGLSAVNQDLIRQMKAVVAQQGGQPVPTDNAREVELLVELQRVVADIQSVTGQIMSTPGSIHLVGDYLARLVMLSDQGARTATSLVDIHHDGVRQLLALGQQRFHLILALYLGLVAGGVALVGVVGAIANRRLATPLRRLAEAARNVAQGQLDAHVEVRSRDEVGQLSHAFNVMAARLLARDRELTATQDQLRRKIQRDARALPDRERDQRTHPVGPHPALGGEQGAGAARGRRGRALSRLSEWNRAGHPNLRRTAGGLSRHRDGYPTRVPRWPQYRRCRGSA